MSVLELSSGPALRRVVPPHPEPALEAMTTAQRIKAVRENVLESWGQAAYEEDIIPERFLGRTSIVVNNPDAIRHVLADNYENYRRTPAGLRVLRPMLGEGVLLAEGRNSAERLHLHLRRAPSRRWSRI